MRRDEDRAIDSFRANLAILYLLKYGLAALTVWAFLYGTAVLALRGAVGLESPDLLWGLATLPLALAPAVVIAFRRLPSRDSIRSVIDRHAHCGGLLMAGAEHSTAEWEESLPELRLPGLRWRSRRSWVLLSLALAFVALAFLVPQSLANLAGPRMDIRPDVEKLARQIDLLEQEKLIDSKRAADLKEKLEQIRRQARGTDPVKTLQALDHVKNLASKEAQDAAETATRKMEELARAQTLAEALEKTGGKMDQAQLAEAVTELAAIARRAAADKDLLEAGLDPATLEALASGKLSPGQLMKLAGSLRALKQNTSGRVGRLVQARLLDPSALEKLDKAGKCDCAALVAYLKENGCTDGLCDSLDGDMAGRGGVNRGPGAAKLNFDHETNTAGAKFKEEELPPSALQTLRDSTLSGLSSATPKTNKEKSGKASSGALAGSKAGGGSASTQVILPRHRNAVERFFERAPMPKK